MNQFPMDIIFLTLLISSLQFQDKRLLTQSHKDMTIIKKLSQKLIFSY